MIVSAAKDAADVLVIFALSTIPLEALNCIVPETTFFILTFCAYKRTTVDVSSISTFSIVIEESANPLPSM